MRPSESHGTRGCTGALPNGENVSEATRHMTAQEQSSVGRRGPELRTHGGTEAIPSWEAGSEAVGHMAAPEPSLAGRRGPKLWDTCQHWSPP
jgi:hypothetical protein